MWQVITPSSARSRAHSRPVNAPLKQQKLDSDRWSHCDPAAPNLNPELDIMTKQTPSPNSRRIRAKVLFLAAAFFSFLGSIWLWFNGAQEAGLFVGIWVPSICSAGALILAGTSND